MFEDDRMDDTDWIDPHTAVKAIAQIESGTPDKQVVAAAERLMRLAREKVLRVKAHKREDFNHPISTTQWVRRPTDETDESGEETWDALVPRSIWSIVSDPMAVKVQFDWRGGMYSGAGDNSAKQMVAMRLTGMELAVADLRRLLPAVDWNNALANNRSSVSTVEQVDPAPASAVAPSTKNKGGAPSGRNGKPIAMLVLQLLARDDEALARENRNSAAAALQAIREGLGYNRLSDDNAIKDAGGALRVVKDHRGFDADEE